MRILFWTAFGIDMAGLLYLLAMLYLSGSPWADLGIIALSLPLSALPMLGFGFAVSKEGNGRLLCLLLVTLAMPCVALPVTMVLTEQFKSAAVVAPESQLAVALRMGNVEGVKRQLPQGAELNRFYGEATRFLANSDVGTGNGRAIVEALLEAGADVNYTEGAEQPAWWAWIHQDGHRVEDVEMVRLMLERGADVKRQARGEGPVTVAVRRQCWETAVLLLEAGAEWQEESAKQVRTAVAMQAYGKQAVPAALAKLEARIVAGR